MRVFLLDLWLDLREKRLTPIAILLVAAIIAIPIALSKSSKSPAPAPAPSTGTTAAAAAPVIQSQAQAGPVASKLQTFTARDPFEPNVKIATTGAAGGATSGTPAATPGTGTSTTTTPTPAGGGGATTGTGPSTGPGNTGTGNTGNTTGGTKTTLFTYTVDLRFGQAGDVKPFKNVKRLDLIPSSSNPKIVFLGVTTTGKTAVFLVDSNIGVDTPGGKCKPNPDNCTFLYLRPDSGHNTAVLTDSDGTVYHLRLLAIHRVTVSSANGTGSNGSSGSGSGRGTNSKRSPAFTGRADSKSSNDSSTSTGNSQTVPASDSPPGEPNNASSFQQFFFADGSSSTSSNSPSH